MRGPRLRVPCHAHRQAAHARLRCRLLPTARGRKLADDPVALWHHLADRLPLSGKDSTDAAWQAGVLLLVLMASGDTTAGHTRIAELLTGLGWAVNGGRPIDTRTVIGLVAEDVRLLQRVGALVGGWRVPWPGEASSDGAALARASLSS